MKKFRRSAGVIIKHGDEVLLCKRSPDETLPNIWSIPGGGIENGESPGHPTGGSMAGACDSDGPSCRQPHL